MAVHYPTLQLGVSACLIGQRVRYDGEDQTDLFCVEQLAPFVRWLPECPEMAIGLGVPRPTIQLIEAPNSSPNRRAIQNTEPKRDITDALIARAEHFLHRHPDCDGYLLMEKSPSCGLTQTKLFDADGNLLGRISQGLFAERLLQLNPALPMIEAARLNDAFTRHHFLTYLYSYRELNDFFAKPFTAAAAQQLWQQHKLQVLAASEAHYRQLGPFIAKLDHRDAQQCAALKRQWLSALRMPPLIGGYLNALHHGAGMVKQKADRTRYRQLNQLLQEVAAEHDALWRALAMLDELALNAPYIRQQRLLNAYPRQLRPQ